MRTRAPVPAEDEPPERVLAGINQRKRITGLAATLSESHPEACEAVASDRQHPVHRRFKLELPVSTIGLQAQEPDAGEVDGVFTVGPNEPKGLEQRCNLSNWPDM